MTNGDRLGIRQRQMLERMMRLGGGSFLPQWRITRSDKAVLGSLHRRGLIALVDHYDDLGEKRAVYRVVTERN